MLSNKHQHKGIKKKFDEIDNISRTPKITTVIHLHIDPPIPAS